MKLSIIIPVYNEKETINQLIGKVFASRLPSGVEKEVIVVNDGSSDGTEAITDKMKLRGLKVIKLDINRGKGVSVREGFKMASGDIMLIQDADLEYSPNDYSKLIMPIINGEAKVVYGSRFINYPLILLGEGKTPLPLHWAGNKLLVVITNLLYGSHLTDMETCYKVISREVLKQLKLRAKRFEIEPEITVQILKKGYKITEIPISVKPRTHAEGKKISWRDGFLTLWTLIKYKFSN